MPQPASSIEGLDFLRLLVLGAPKSGKTHTILATCEKPAYVINSDDPVALRPATRVTTEFEYDYAPGSDANTIEKCIHAAREGVKEGRYKTVVWDTISSYATRVEAVFEAADNSDGRRYWSRYKKHLEGIVDRLLMLKCHVIVASHYIQGGVAIEGQAAKSGEGVMPLIAGQARTTIPAKFQDIVYLDKKAGNRFFVTASEGVWGPGCRNLPGVATCEADVSKLWALMKKR